MTGRPDLRGVLLSEHARQVQEDFEALLTAARAVVGAQFASNSRAYLLDRIDELAEVIDRITA